MSTIFEFKDKQHPQAGDALHFQLANPGDAQHVAAKGFDAAAPGAARVSPHIIRPAGVGSALDLGQPGVLHRLAAQQGIEPEGVEAPPFGRSTLGSFIRASFARPYAPPASYQLPFQFTPDHGTPLRVVSPHTFNSQAFGAGKVLPSPYLRPRGLDATLWGDTGVINKSELLQAVEPGGFVATSYGNANAGRALRFKFDNPAYEIPPGNAVAFDFVLQGGTQGIYAGLGNQSAFGVALLGSSVQSVKVDGIYSQAIGAARVRYTNVLRAQGFVATGFGWPALQSLRKYVFPAGFAASLYGTAQAWNLRQYVGAAGFRADRHGSSTVLGGVKHVAPEGMGAPPFGQTLVINTTADQTARPPGIEPPLLQVPKPFVSPQTVLAAGFYSFVGGIALVQRNPSPKGWDGLLWGRPFVYQKTRYVRPAGIDGFETGYPRAADKARKLLHKASAVSAVFGDTRLRLKDYRIQPAGFDASEPSPWAEVRNTRRFVLAQSVAPAGVGQGTQASNKTPSIAPTGFASQAFGRPDHMVVGWQVRELRPSGVPAPLSPIGWASLWQTPSLGPVGIAPPAIPGPSVWPAIRTIEQWGALSQEFGKPRLDYAYRRVNVGGQGIDGAEYGQARLEHLERSVAPEAFRQDGYGQAWVSFGQRKVAPVTVPPPTMGIPQVGGTRFLRPDGFQATRWGTRITPEARVLYPLGFREVWGWPEVRNRVRFLEPDSIRTYPQPYQHWGKAKAWNKRQFIEQYEDQSSELWPPSWPLWTAIANRTRVVGTLGALAGVVGKPSVENKARPLLPVGVAAPVLPEFYKAGLVAFRIRPLPLEGIEPPYFAGWSNVANGARVIKPTGRVHTSWGRPAAENTRRNYKLLGFDSAWFGYPFIADRIRTLTFEPRYTIGAPPIKPPDVRLHVRYIGAKGIDHPEVGAAALEIHWNRISPRWTLQNLYGHPVLHNVTPELRTRGRAADEWGVPLVRQQWRPLVAIGAETTLFGRAMIADRKQTIRVSGANYLAVSDKLVVVRTGAPPYTTQYISLEHPNNTPDEPKDGFGIGPPEVPRPVMQQQVIYVSELLPQTLFGRPVVHANSIRVEPGIYELTVGEPMVSLLRRRMTVGGIDPQTEVGAPRLSPHTIWAVVEAPKQAVDNHPKRQLHYVDSMKTGGIGAVLGAALVQNRHRSIYSGSAGFGEGFGAHRLENRKQYLGVYGFQMLRMGWHTIPGDHLIEVDPMDTGNVGPGEPRVSRPPYTGPQYLAPQGITAKVSAELRVEHFNRTLLARGHDSMALGESWSLDRPYQWQTLHVGTPMPTIPTGFDAAHFGPGTWVSHRVRELQVGGWDSFASEYDYQQFNKRMRVRLGMPGGGVPRRVSPRGDVHSSVGAPGLRPGTHYIRPDGNSDQFRKGAF